MTRRYLDFANICEQSNGYLFRPIVYCKRSNTYVLRGETCLSYTRAREILLSALGSLGLDKSKFGLHSLRAGGATAAANLGISDRLFKKHGQWKSDAAKDGYVTENIAQRLSVTKHLGI